MSLSLRQDLKQTHLGSPHYFIKDRFLLAHLCFIDMLKDLVDSIKPYKSPRGVVHDAIQLLKGLGNLGLAMVDSIFFLIGLVTSIARFLVDLGKKDKPVSSAIHDLGVNLLSTTSMLIYAAALTIRGLSQIATAPLTWFIRMPIRSCICLVKGGFQFFTDNTSVKILTEKLTNIIHENKPGSKAAAKAICARIHEKLIKAAGRGQRINIVIGEYRTCRNDIVTDYSQKLHYDICEMPPAIKNGEEVVKPGKLYIETVGVSPSQYIRYIAFGMDQPDSIPAMIVSDQSGRIDQEKLLRLIFKKGPGNNTLSTAAIQHLEHYLTLFKPAPTTLAQKSWILDQEDLDDLGLREFFPKTRC